MIDLTRSRSASPLLQTVESDPGRVWVKDERVAIDAPPDDDILPTPGASWPSHAKRSGICGAVSPRILVMPDGNYRMYYSQILPRDGFPAGANDYDNASTRILSAFSEDGMSWTPEPGVRLSSENGGAGKFRVVSSEVVPFADGTGLRMYYECCVGPQSQSNSIRSAISTDGGLNWAAEPGVRLEVVGHNISSPRIQFLNNHRCRLYCLDRGYGIISALSSDGGVTFQIEPGLRIDQSGLWDSHVAFAPEILRVANSGYVMFYAGYSGSNRASILRAVSEDGLNWKKEDSPVIKPGPGGWDAVKCSEMCLIPLPKRHSDSKLTRYRMLYEACDGTATNERGVWRIASATSV